MRNSQSPSIHSIYQNALPFYLDRADLRCIVADGDPFPDKFLGQLLNGEASLQFDASELNADKVRHLYFESRNLVRTMGAKTLGLGYPLLIDTFEGELMVAPLLIWQITLEPAQTKVNAWVLRFDKQHPIMPNQKIINYLQEKYDYDCTGKFLEILTNWPVSKIQIQAFAKELADRFLWENLIENGDLADAPGIDEIGSFSDKGAVHWSAVLSIFPPQHLHKTTEKPNPEDVFVETPMLPDADPFIFPYIATDPEQVTAQETAMTKPMTVVEGVDALGKSQTLLNILISALAQGKKCLVVSERAPALKKTQELLGKTGINQLNFLLTDAVNEKDQLLELLKVAAKGTGRDFPLDEKDFQYKKNKYLREKQRLNETYSAVQAPVFGEQSWTETVGAFLANNRLESRELLASHLNRSDFSFDKNEHQRLRTGVSKCAALFGGIKTLGHPLADLNDRLFQQVDMADGQNYLTSQLDLFLQKGRELHHRYISVMANYRLSLKTHFDEYSVGISQKKRQLEELLLSYKDQLGNDFLKARPRAIEWPVLFSKKKKLVKAAQAEVAKGYNQLRETFEQKPYFDFQFPTANGGLHVADVRSGLAGFGEAFDHWQQKLEVLIQEDAARLNNKTAHPGLGVKEEISQLELALDGYLAELNAAHVYQKPFENKNLTIPKRQKFLETVIEQLENTRNHLHEFPPFYEWQSEWLRLGAVGQKVVAGLVKTKPQNWTAAFESWYFSNLLFAKQNTALPTGLEASTNGADATHALKPLVLNHIFRLWQKRQSDSLKTLKKADKETFLEIFEKNAAKRLAASKSIAGLLGSGMETITDFFPILFVSQHVANHILPKNFLFDYVIFEEANRFSVEPAVEIAALGKQKLIFGSNSSQGNETSLLQYALENGVSSARITNQYEAPLPFLASHPDAIHAFHFARNVSVEALEGRFHEVDGTNDFEAQHVIRLLNQVKQTPQRVYPTVGIVTFTVEQRDLISDYILKLKQQNAVGSEKIRDLERNGMGVFQVNELFGQQFDVLIVSCTFGAINLKGKLAKRFAMLNTEEGISTIQLLINKPVQKLFLLHSFTDAHLDEMMGKSWEKGAWLLAHFIKMAEAAEQENEVKFLEQLEVIGKKEKRQPLFPCFSEEVAKALSAYIEPGRIAQQQPWEDLILPIVVSPLSPAAAKIVVLPDGFFSATAFTSAVWEQSHLAKLAASNFQVVPVWSVNWLKDPAQEARKLAGHIINLDQENK